MFAIFDYHTHTFHSPKQCSNLTCNTTVSDHGPWILQYICVIKYSETCLKWPLKNVLKPYGSLIKVKSTEECSCGAFCSTFDLHSAIIGFENLFFRLSLSGHLWQVLLYCFWWKTGMLTYLFSLIQHLLMDPWLYIVLKKINKWRLFMWFWWLI